MKVIIAEKPGVAKDIAAVLKVKNRKNGFIEGNGYIITWAIGHLISLADPNEYDKKYENWDPELLPIIPEVFITVESEDEGLKKQYNVIKEIFNDDSTTEIICATDAGREGELIFRYIYQQAQCTKPIKRLWISSQTDQAILEGLNNLKSGSEYDTLFHSAISRSEADWLIGINTTRAYTRIFSNKEQGVMTVGRVQTPVLKMIVDRYHEKNNFISQEYSQIVINIEHNNGKYLGTWFDLESKLTKFANPDRCKSTFESIKSIPTGTIHSVTKKEIKVGHPLLYDLTALQKDANRIYKFTADNTLKLTQALYETHKILTYPRTSSRYLSEDIVPKLNGLIEKLLSVPDYSDCAQFLLGNGLKITKRIVDDSKVTDHHAIIPTDKKPDLKYLSEDERKIYDLVIRRFFSVFYPDQIKDQTEIITTFGSHYFRTAGTVIKQAGWKSLYSGDDDDENDDDNFQSNLPAVKNNDRVSQIDLNMKKGKTKPPALYTEATILGAMETAGKQIDDEEMRDAMKECGLGTPATRAQVLERLVKVKYIVREKNYLLPTDKGIFLINSIQDQALLSPELTGRWEKKLNDIVSGKYSRPLFMEEIKQFTREIIANVKAAARSTPKFKSTSNFHSSKNIIGKCLLCGGDIIEKEKSFSCSNWKSKECTFVIWKEIAGKTISEPIAKQLLTGKPTSVLKGFTSSNGKPFETKLKIKNGKVEFVFENNKPPR